MTSVSCTVFGTVSSMRVRSDWHADLNKAGSAANLVKQTHPVNPKHLVVVLQVALTRSW